MINKVSPLLFLTLVFLSLLLSSAYSGINSELTGIEVKEVDGSTEIEIQSTSPLNYTIYKPGDPYIVMVEFQDTVLGRFNEKMLIDRAGVLEIIPSMVEGMENVVRLEIGLTVPVEVKPIQRGGSLVLAFVNPEAEAPVVAEAPLHEEAPVVAEAAVPGEEGFKDARVIENIEFSKSGDKLLVKISGDGRMIPKVLQPDTNKLVVDIPDVTTNIEAPKVYEPPMGGMRIGTYPDKTRIVFDLTEPTEYDVSSEGKQIIVSFKMPAVSPPATPVMAKVEVPAAKEKIPMIPETEAPRCYSEAGYIGEKVSLDFQEADLIHIFRLLADVSGCNIVVSPKVKGKFSMRLRDVPWDQALDVILRNYGLSKKVEGNIIRVALTKEITDEEKAIAERKEAELAAGDPITRLYQLSYAKVRDAKKIIDDISKQKAGAGGQKTMVSTDERTNALLIRDVEPMHREYERVIETIDKPTPQVLIDARIVEVTTNFTRELGIQWGADVRLSSQTKIGGVENLIGGKGFATDNPLLVNLPAPALGAIGFGYIGAGSLRALDMQLSAMESTGKGKIISNPRIITTDNQKAKIQQGKKIPYLSVSAEGTQTAFVDAALELNVTPRITPSGTILMEINTKKNEADFAQTVSGVPTIDTKEAETNVLVNDGDTLVIGGIFKTNITESENYVPLFGKIPVLGWLFKKKKMVKDTTELLIFITPRVIKQ